MQAVLDNSGLSPLTVAVNDDVASMCTTPALHTTASTSLSSSCTTACVVNVNPPVLPHQAVQRRAQPALRSRPPFALGHRCSARVLISKSTNILNSFVHLFIIATCACRAPQLEALAQVARHASANVVNDNTDHMSAHMKATLGKK